MDLNEKDVKQQIAKIILSEQDPHAQIAGYNFFLDIALPSTVKQYCTMDFTTTQGVTIKSDISNVRYSLPKKTPQQVQKLYETYSASVYIDVIMTINGVQLPKVKGYKLLDIPVIVGSNACCLSQGLGHDEISNTEYGGYFIINGKRKYIDCKRDFKRNVPILRPMAKKGRYKNITSVSVRCDHLGNFGRSSSTVKILVGKKAKDKYGVSVQMPYAQQKTISLSCLLAVMKVDVLDFLKELERISSHYKYLESYTSRIIAAKMDYNTAVATMKKNYDQNLDMFKFMKSKVDNILFPHIGEGEEFMSQKLTYLTYLVEKAILSHEGYGTRPNLEDLQFFNLHETGYWMTNLLRTKLNESMNKNISKIRKQGKDNIVDVEKLFKCGNAGVQMRKSISTGRWTNQVNGICADMNANNQLEALCNLRKVSTTTIQTKGKHMNSRIIRNSHKAKLCVVRTVEGVHCGLKKELASTCTISPYDDQLMCNNHVLDAIQSQFEEKGSIKIFDCLGHWVGNVLDKNDFISYFRLRRAQGFFSKYVTIVELYTDELFIFCEMGRMLVPVARDLSKFKPGMTLERLYADGIIELREDLTDAELLFPGQLIGINAGQNPFINHNMAPRSTYQTGMAFQATSSVNYDEQGKSTLDSAEYAQLPLVQTFMAQATGLDMTALRGQCMNVAIAAYDANQEDAFVFNKSMLERGGFRRATEASYRSEMKNSSDKFHRPNPSTTQNLQMGSYEHIQNNGLPKKRQKIKKGDIVISKTIPSISKEGTVIIPLSMASQKELRRDVSIHHKHGPGIVTKAFASKSDPFTHTVSIMSNYDVEPGDKFASRHGQKGTVGMIMNQEDMPFDQHGITPDIIISPESFPSRMTMGKQLEMLFGKAVALSGDTKVGFDDQSFESQDKLKVVEEILFKYGFQKDGSTMLTDGRTGRVMDCDIFVGLVHYAQLTHFVNNKMFVRSTGNISALTRQPNPGRKNHGGLRYGVMESDNTVALGASAYLQDRMYDATDKHTYYRCKKCFNKAEANPRTRFLFCGYCGTGDHVRRVDMCFTTGLMLEEAKAMGMTIDLELEDVDETLPGVL